MTKLSEQERHSVEHARYQAVRATPEDPECCFDYELVKTLVGIIDRLAAQPQSPQEPAAWRWRFEGENFWTLCSKKPRPGGADVICEPLYADTRPLRKADL